ncbi:hypothetical protein ACFL2Q_16470, partial [Thermodesulfobacteriota bacterium]
LPREDIIACEEAIYLVASEGVHSCRRPVPMDLPTACGDAQGVGIAKDGKDGFLIATGERARTALKWFPTERRSGPTKAANKKREGVKYRFYALAHLGGLIYEIEWRDSSEEVDHRIVGFVDASGRHTQLSHSMSDFDGYLVSGPNPQEALGVLEISYKAQKETWLIFNAPGVEGDGVYAVRMDDIGSAAKSHGEWVVYNGC